jgi:putative membrane protein
MSDRRFDADPDPDQGDPPSAARSPQRHGGPPSRDAGVGGGGGDDHGRRHRGVLARWGASLVRRERRLEQTGNDPDPRYTFANERTFLAWNRTALALIAAGLAAAQFLKFNLHGLRLIIAVPLIVLGAALALASYTHWQDSERAMRLRQPLRYSWMPLALTGGIVAIALGGAILAVVDRLVK